MARDTKADRSLATRGAGGGSRAQSGYQRHLADVSRRQQAGGDRAVRATVP